MTGTARVSVATMKEVRAIAPAWAACLVSIGLASSGRPWLRGAVIPVYCLGAIALGALSIGHEFSGGTLTMLLSQPRRRAHVFLLKLSVLALMLLALAAVARIALSDVFGAPPPPRFGVDGERWPALVLMLPLLCGLFIAPCLTLLCRSPLAGMVFTIATPGVLMLVGELFASMYGSASATALDPGAVRVAFLWRGVFAISAVASVFGWRLFMRLEATGDHVPAVRLPWLREPPVTMAATSKSAKHHPLWLLTKKELHLQQLSFVVAGFYLLGWLSVWSARWRNPGIADALLFALTNMNTVAVSLLAGSLASAEERQLGAIEWHTLLPISARTQWAIKAGTALGVAVVLGLGVPALLSSVARSAQFGTWTPPPLTAGIAVMLVTAVSLYVSSVCKSGVQALVWSLPVALGVLALAISWPGVQFLALNGFNYTIMWRNEDLRLMILLLAPGFFVLVTFAAGIGLLVRFAYVNHRSAERGSRRIWNQALRVGAFLALVVALWSGVSRILDAEWKERNRVWMQRLGR